MPKKEKDPEDFGKKVKKKINVKKIIPTPVLEKKSYWSRLKEQTKHLKESAYKHRYKIAAATVIAAGAGAAAYKINLDKKEKQLLKQEKENLNKQNQSLNKQNQGLINRIKELKTPSEPKPLNIDTLNNYFDELKKFLEKAKNQNVKTTSELTKLFDSSKQQNTEMKNINKNIEKAISDDNQEQIKQLRSLLIQSDSKRKLLHSEIKGYKSILNEQEIELEKTETALNKLDEATKIINNLKLSDEEKEKQLKKLTENLVVNHGIVEQLIKEKEELKRRIDKLLSELGEKNIQIDNLLKQITKLESDLSNQEQQLRNNIDKLLSDFETNSILISNLKSQLDIKNKELESSNLLNIEQKQKLKNELVDITSKFNKINSNYASSLTKINELEKTINELTHQIALNDTQLKQKQSEIVQKQSDINQKQSEIVKLKESSDNDKFNLNMEIGNLTKELMLMTSDLIKIRSELTDAAIKKAKDLFEKEKQKYEKSNEELNRRLVDNVSSTAKEINKQITKNKFMVTSINTQLNKLNDVQQKLIDDQKRLNEIKKLNAIRNLGLSLKNKKMEKQLDSQKRLNETRVTIATNKVKAIELYNLLYNSLNFDLKNQFEKQIISAEEKLKNLYIKGYNKGYKPKKNPFGKSKFKFGQIVSINYLTVGNIQSIYDNLIEQENKRVVEVEKARRDAEQVEARRKKLEESRLFLDKEERERLNKIREELLKNVYNANSPNYIKNIQSNANGDINKLEIGAKLYSTLILYNEDLKNINYKDVYSKIYNLINSDVVTLRNTLPDNHTKDKQKLDMFVLNDLKKINNPIYDNIDNIQKFQNDLVDLFLIYNNLKDELFPVRIVMNFAIRNVSNLTGLSDSEVNSNYYQTQQVGNHQNIKNILPITYRKINDIEKIPNDEYGPYFKVTDTNNTHNAYKVKEDILTFLDNDSDKLPHLIYSAYGFSGSGKSYTLIANANKNNMLRKIMENINEIIIDKKLTNVIYKYRMYDIYGEIKSINNDDKGCNIPNVTDNDPDINPPKYTYYQKDFIEFKTSNNIDQAVTHFEKIRKNN